MKASHSFAMTLRLAPLFLVLCTPSKADTVVGGFIDSDTIWSSSNSPYIVQQSVLISGSATLLIKAGVTVKLHPAQSIVVTDGDLVCEGTAESNIVFTSSVAFPNEIEQWGNIQIANGTDAEYDPDGTWTNGSGFEFTVFENGGNSSVNGSLHVDSDRPHISDCVFRNNSSVGLWLYGFHDGRVLDCTFRNNISDSFGGGFFAKSSDRMQIKNCLAYSNDAPQSGVYGDGGGLYIEDSHSVLVVSNSIYGNNAPDDGGGLCFRNCDDLKTIGNHVWDNFGNAGGGFFYSDCNGAISETDSIHDNSGTRGGGLFIEGVSDHQMHGVKIVRNVASDKGGGIYITPRGNANNAVQLSVNSNNPSWVLANDIYNALSFSGSADLASPGNIDARNVYWGTESSSEIAAQIFDFYDDSGKGIVFYQPFSFPFDIWRAQYGLSTNDAPSGDRDGDLSSNWEEFKAGTDPTNSFSFLGISKLTYIDAAKAVICWQSVTSRIYSITTFSDLSQGASGPFRTGIPATPPMNCETVTYYPLRTRYFRIDLD